MVAIVGDNINDDVKMKQRHAFRFPQAATVSQRVSPLSEIFRDKMVNGMHTINKKHMVFTREYYF